MTKLSIIIPVFNTDEKYLRECLDSVIRQTMQEIEIICVNDGSTDGSLDILNEYSKKDSRIIVIDKENAGVSVARNYGIDRASGEYIMFLDSDDYFLPEACQTVYETVCAENSDLGIFGHFTKKGKRIKPVPIANSNTFMDYINVWNKIFKTSFLRENNIRFPNGIVTAEDIIFSYDVYFNNPKISYINKHFIIYRTRPSYSVTYKLNEIKTDTEALAVFMDTEIFNSQTLENRLKVVERFSSIIGWLGAKTALKDDKIYCRNLLTRYLELLEANFEVEDLEKLKSYTTCKNIKELQENKPKLLDKIFSKKLSDDEQDVIITFMGLKFKSRISN